jgi:hypothetical protein
MSDQLEKIIQIKRQNEKKWLSLKSVVGVGIGLTSGGDMGIIVATKEESVKVRKKIPREIERIPVEIKVTGEIKALD